MLFNNNPWGDDIRKTTNEQNIDDILSKLYKQHNPFNGNGFNLDVKIVFVVLFLFVIGWLVTGFYIVEPDESGVELVFGKYQETTSPGLNYNFPAPIGTTFKVKTATVYKEDIAVHKDDVSFKLYSTGSNTSTGVMLTGDENIVNISFQVQWRIRDPYKYLFNLRDDFSDNNTIKSAAESAMRESIGQNSINLIMIGEGRSKVAMETHDLLQKMLDYYDVGVELLSVQLIKVDPPEKVIDSFRDVQSAKADKERQVNQAQSYYNDKIPKSRGAANKIVQDAEAYKQQVISNAQGEAQQFKSIYYEYKNNKDITRTRLYLETLETILHDLDKVIIEKNSGAVPYLPMHDLLKKK